MRYLGLSVVLLGVVVALASHPVLAQTADCVVAPEGLVGWWPGDTDARDIVASNDGALVNVAFAPGLVADAFSFDGAASARMEIADTADLRFAGSFTVNAWIETTHGGTDHSTPIGVYVADVVRKRHRDNGGQLDIVLGMIDNTTGSCCGSPTPGPVARFVIVDDHGNVATAQGATPINNGAWHLLTGVRDTETGVVRLYVDGQLESFVPDTLTTCVEVNAVPWFVGNTSGLGPFGIFPWHGLIDEVQLFDRALSAGEVLALYDAGAAGTCKDNDGDGFWPPDDCDEADADVNPDAIELPGNFVDENCNGDLGSCDPCASWNNHGHYIRCVSSAVNDLLEAGVITEDSGDVLVQSAARSDVGKPGHVPVECE